jgi:hypothetical protein
MIVSVVITIALGGHRIHIVFTERERTISIVRLRFTLVVSVGTKAAKHMAASLAGSSL